MHKNNSVLKATGALPLWKCHKVVGGSKIVDAQILPGGGGILVLECGFSATVDKHYVDKHSPLAGGYFVVYEDGYQSFSPAEAFKNGYTRIEERATSPGPQPIRLTQFQIVAIAEVCHETNRAYCKTLCDNSQVPWDETPVENKTSSIEEVEAHLNNPLMTAEQSHKSWYNHKESEGWVYGEEKDLAKKTHPCMVSYFELPVSQQVKDSLFSSVVSVMSEGFKRANDLKTDPA